ncbi:MAG: Type 1 glutamine amidotransferase-like domain-containing protein [Sellimonas sp.]|nr:Type 1 glutamine amidotransferase-like domain-containing protein [Sellimonas sp.]
MVKSAEELDGTNVENYSAIFIGGGNTYKLLNDLKASGSFEKIKAYIEQDGIVFGGSAGAIIFGYDIESCAAMDQNKVGLKDTKGFDVLSGYSVFAHYTNGSSRLTEQENRERTERYTEKLLRYSQEHGPVIAMPEEDTLFLNGDHLEMIGSRPYYCFEGGKRREMIP